jgi:hypothetical protein
MVRIAGKFRRVRMIAAVALVLVFLGLTPAAAQAATPADIEQSIEKGLAWLAGQQNAADGSWGTDYRVARTGLAVLKFETHAVFMGMSPFDPAYTYQPNVVAGLDYIFSRAFDIAIGVQPAGDPDTNGNGKGVCCYYDSGRRIYETGIALMAICAGNDPDRVVGVGSQVGRKYSEVAQDIVDYIAFGQADSGSWRGGWRYAENSGADNSVSGYATLGLIFAEAKPPWGFDLTIPPFVYSELNLWIDYIQTDQLGGTNDGGSGYTGPGDPANILRTGNLLSEMALVGDTQGSTRVGYAVEYMERHWNDPNRDPGWNGGSGTPHYQACFTAMKGFQGLGIEEIEVGGNPVNWYDDMADAIVNTQNADGSWPSDNYGNPQLTTCWAMLTLEKAAPPALAVIPPVASSPVGSEHTVTAVYEVAGVPQVGVQINFVVTAGPNAGDSGSSITSDDGEATFTYMGDGGEGEDTIQATAVDAGGNPLISGQATIDWTVAAKVPGVTTWGLIGAALLMAILIPFAVKRRVFAAGSR